MLMPWEMMMVIGKIYEMPTMYQYPLYINLLNVSNNPHEVGIFRFILQM